MQNKAYSRDALARFNDGGRCRIKLKNDAGQPLNPEIPNSGFRFFGRGADGSVAGNALFTKIATYIPKLKTRQSAAAAAASSSQTSGNKKKNKR